MGKDNELFSGKRSWYLPFLLFAIALIARLATWPYSDVVDADAVSRALSGEGYMLYPGWVGDGIWPPLHFYLNGFFTLLCGGRQIGSVFVNILLGSAIVFPVYYYVRRWSEPLVACAVVLLVVFNPLLFRNSLQGLSEIPFFFFSVCAFNSISIASSDRSRRGVLHAVLAGVFITIASGIRYEAWLLIILLASIIMVTGNYKRVHFFLLPAMIFPATWMITNHYAQGNLFKGFEHILHWQGHATEQIVTENELVLRSIFFPVSLLLVLSPLAVLAALTGTTLQLIRKNVPTDQWIWLILFPLFLLLIVSKTRHAEILTQHRFTTTLVLTFIPFLVIGLNAIKQKWVTILGATSISVLGLIASFNAPDRSWILQGIGGSHTDSALATIRDKTAHELESIPKLKSDLPDRLVQKLNTYSWDRRLLVMDFFGWQETYNVAFKTKVRPTSIVFLPDQNPNNNGIAHLDGYLGLVPQFSGILLLAKGSPYHTMLQPTTDGKFVLHLAHKDLVLWPIGAYDNVSMYSFDAAAPEASFAQ